MGSRTLAPLRPATDRSSPGDRRRVNTRRCDEAAPDDLYRALSGYLSLNEPPDLDRHPNGITRPGCPVQRSLKIRRLDDVEAANLLLDLHERAVGHADLAISWPDDFRRGRLIEPAPVDPSARCLEGLIHGEDVRPGSFPLFGRHLRALLSR